MDNLKGQNLKNLGHYVKGKIERQFVLAGFRNILSLKTDAADQVSSSEGSKLESPIDHQIGHDLIDQAATRFSNQSSRGAGFRNRIN
jgi:hypothetical protein